jgi:hypothetical protein
MLKMLQGGTTVGAANTDLDNLIQTWASGFYDELDFELEGERQMEFRREILQHTSGCYVPKVFSSARRVLVSEWVDGVKLADCEPEDIQVTPHVIRVRPPCATKMPPSECHTKLHTFSWSFFGYIPASTCPAK